MKIDIHVTAESLEELWRILEAFPQAKPSLPQPLLTPPETHSRHVVPEHVRQTEAGAVTVPEHTKGNGAATVEAAEEKKRGRPPGAKNKPKAPEPEEAEEPSQEVQEAEESVSPDETRVMIADALTMHWKENVKAKRDVITKFKDEVGIRMLAEMKPEHFPAARKTLNALQDMSQP